MNNYDNILTWIESRFNDYQVHGDEIKIHDIWWINRYGEPDKEYKLWINTNKQCFHALKSGKKGNLIELVKELEKCSYSEAKEILGYETSPIDFEKKLAKILEDDAALESTKIINSIELPSYTFLINNLSNAVPIRNTAVSYLQSRKIPTDNLFICTSGDLKNRIIIPYYDKDKKLIYWNGRDISGKAKQKYKGPDKDISGIGKGDVLWMKHWYKDGSTVYLTEGEFDAMSLYSSELNGVAAGSKNVTNKHIELLKNYKVIFSFDNDIAGSQWIETAKHMMDNGFHNLGYVIPPNGFKDWNELLVKTNEKIVNQYIKQNQENFNLMNFDKLMLNKI